MHDMWPCTAICHYAGQCQKFHSHCHSCPQLLYPSAHDLSFKTFDAKLKLYQKHHITFVTCSRWLAGQAAQSRLLQGQRILSIPNTYNASVLHPSDMIAARRHHHLPETGKLLLFACQKVTNPLKGLDFLLRALPLVKVDGLQLVMVGQLADSTAAAIPYPIHRIGYIDGEKEMALLYNAVDAFVTPSLEDNLPNTIMEAMAVGTPCIGFNTGGIPEMIDHELNGYVARYRDAEDLAQGISYVLDDTNNSRLAKAATEKATTVWNEQRVTEQYIKVYEQIN